MNYKLYVTRRENKLKQKDIAKQIGMSEKSYQLKETGQRSFTIEEGLKLSRIYNCTLDDLFGDRESTIKPSSSSVSNHTIDKDDSKEMIKLLIEQNKILMKILEKNR